MMEDWLNQPMAPAWGIPWTALQLSLFSVTVLVVLTGAWFVRRMLKHRLLAQLPLTESERSVTAAIVHAVILVFGLIGAVEGLGLNMAGPFLTLGGTEVSIFTLAVFFLSVSVVIVGAGIMGRLTEDRFLGRTRLDEGIRYAIGRMVYYVVMVAGLMAALQTIGVDLASLTVILGALSVGIGFGLQNVVNNFVSGIILLFERPIKVGDWIKVEDTRGKVTRIGARSTSVVTRDNITVIIPNGDLLSSHLVNWSHGGPQVRVRIPVGIAFGTDMEKVRQALLEVARQQPDVLKKPEPKVFFDRFGDSALQLDLALWIDIRHTGLRALRSDLNFAIDEAFRRERIETPSPQLDIRVRGGEMAFTAPEPSPEDEVPAGAGRGSGRRNGPWSEPPGPD